MKAFKSMLLGLATMAITACGNDFKPVIAEKNPSNSAQEQVPGQAFDIEDATPEQCAAGGKIYSVYVDMNQDFIRQEEERVINSQIVCNGANGASGANGSNGSNGQDGTNGTNGSAGTNGTNGHSIVFTTVEAPREICPAGGSTLLIATDIKDGGVYDPTFPNQTSMTVCNGENAQVPKYSIVETIKPCGETVPYKEVLLRLANGQVLGSFSDDANGKMTRLAFLPDGSYVNTDNSKCSFSLQSDKEQKTRSVSWFGKEQMSWKIEY